MDDRKKIIFQDMEFCEIECFLNSRYFDVSKLEEVQEAKKDYEDTLSDFKKSEDEKATLEALNSQFVEQVEGLLEKYDAEFESGNRPLDEILLALTKAVEDFKK